MAEGRGVTAFYDEFEVRQTTRVYLFHTVSCTIQKRIIIVFTHLCFAVVLTFG